MGEQGELEQPTIDEAQRRGRLVLRALPILLIPVLVAVLTGVLLRLSREHLPPPPGGPPGGPGLWPLVPIIVLVVFCTALIVLVRLGKPTISALALIGAWTMVTTGMALRGGVTSVFPALLIIPICAAGLLIDGAASISLAALATVLIGSMAWLEAEGLSAPLSRPPLPIERLAPISASFWVGVFWSVAALTFLLAGGLQRALRQSRAQALALQNLSSQLEARVAAQTAALLEGAQEAATLEERARLARDIHDTIAQGLAGISVQLGAAQRALAVAPVDAEEHVTIAQRMAREALAEARRSVWNLRAPALERGDLADALRGLATRPLADGAQVSFAQQGHPWTLPPAAEGALLRVAQEALANAARHAQASAVALMLAYEDDAVRLTVADDGVGFDDDALAAVPAQGPAGGFGLLGMRERLAALGGTLTLRNNGGAELVATVPRAFTPPSA